MLIKVSKRKLQEYAMENESKKILLDPVSLNNQQLMTENDEHYIFDEDELIVYSPEGSFEEFVDENEEVVEHEEGETFLQRENCFITSTELPKCRECTKDDECDKYSCRFYEFRKIERNSKGECKVVGFLDPHLDPSLSGKSSSLKSF